MLNFVHDGVIATDENGSVTVINHSAERIFGVNQEEIIGRQVKEFIRNTKINEVIESGIAQLNQLQETSLGHIISNRIPIMINENVKGVVATFQDVKKIQGMEQKIRKNFYEKGLVTKYNFNNILTKDNKMKRMIEIAKEYAKTDATILIIGQSGTRKEMLAQSIHEGSTRSTGPFVAINCAALPPQLLESELFGYVEGGFTGAIKGGKMGHFELAHKGAIFLDEIGQLEMVLQARLLRVLQEKQVMRIGSDRIIPVDIRVVAATNANLRKLVSMGEFRADLYYRLNVLNLKTMHLKKRKGDIIYLCYYFIRKFNGKYGKYLEKWGQDLSCFLKAYQWPGNVREFRNIMERNVLSTNKDCIVLEDIDLLIEEIIDQDNFEENELYSSDLLNGTFMDIKKKMISKVLQE